MLARFEINFDDEGAAPIVLRAVLGAFQVGGMRLLTPEGAVPARLRSTSLLARLAVRVPAILNTRVHKGPAPPFDAVVEGITGGLRVNAIPQSEVRAGLIVPQFQRLLRDAVSRLEAGGVPVNVVGPMVEPQPHLR